MRKYLLPHTGQFYKANLHSHSTVSDGRLSPEEMKAAYMEQGYSIIAYTDHEVIVPHPELADAQFLPLNGYEASFPENNDASPHRIKSSHLCLIALEPDNLKHVCKHRTEWPDAAVPMAKYRDQMQFLYEDEPDFIRDHTPKCINEVIDRARKNGFFVTYNHPRWSLDDYSDYMAYQGMHAMEICNGGSVALGNLDHNEKEYDDMLRGGKRLFCIAADDNHNKPGRKSDSFGAFTMIKAEKLEYRTITKALTDGHFYASQGPLIHELWYEDGKIHVSCSDAARIVLYTDTRRTQVKYAPEGGSLTEAVLDVPQDVLYVRITVTDATGKHANTNAYFTETFQD